MNQQAQSMAAELDRAIRHHQAGELDAAKAIYSRILEADPRHPDALNLSGVVAHQTGHQETAIRLIERAISIDDGNASYYNNLGEALRAFGRHRDAIEAYGRALAINPGDVAAHNNAGLAFQSLQQYDDARACYERALALAPNDVEVWLNLGNLHREFCRLDESADAFRRAIDIFPGLPAGHASLGITLYESGDADAAVAALERAVELDPLYLEAHENLKKVRWFRGEHERVNDSFRAACERLPGSARAFCNLGVALLGSHDYRGAEQALRRAVGIEPRFGDAHDALGRALRGMDRVREAIEAHERAVECAPDNALYREEFGVTLIRAGEFARAADELRKGHALNPRRSAILGFLAIALNELGDPAVDELVDYDRFLEIAKIDVPAGYESLDAFNADLHDEIRRHFHNPYHPMDQTMRGGTQTPNNLFQNPSGLVLVLKEQITKVVKRFIDELEGDTEHPFLRFINPDFVFTGVWSTIIDADGYDGSHIHNEGWLSGTYYVKVPDFDEAQLENKDGFIQFGEPPPPYVSERNTVRHTVTPEAGAVVLFPSYYWHGVRRFDRNGVRHSVSYDMI